MTDVEDSEANLASKMKAGKLRSLTNIDCLLEVINSGWKSEEVIGVTKEMLLKWRKEYINKLIKHHLKRARSNPSTYTAKMLRKLLKETGLSPKEYGTSDEEINKIEQQAIKSLNQQQLERLGRYGSWHTVNLIENGLVKTGVELTPEVKERMRTLRSQVTSEERKAEKRQEASQYLLKLRRGKSVTLYDWFMRALKLACATPEDLGTTTEELEMLKRRGYMAQAEKIASELKDPEKKMSAWFRSQLMSRFHEALKIINMTPEDFGVLPQHLA